MFPHQWFVKLDIFFRQEIMRVTDGRFPYMEDFFIIFRSRLGDAGEIITLVVVDISVVSQFCLMEGSFIDETVLFQDFLRTFIMWITSGSVRLSFNFSKPYLRRLALLQSYILCPNKSRRANNPTFSLVGFPVWGSGMIPTEPTVVAFLLVSLPIYPPD